MAIRHTLVLLFAALLCVHALQAPRDLDKEFEALTSELELDEGIESKANVQLGYRMDDEQTKEYHTDRYLPHLNALSTTMASRQYVFRRGNTMKVETYGTTQDVEQVSFRFLRKNGGLVEKNGFEVPFRHVRTEPMAGNTDNTLATHFWEVDVPKDIAIGKYQLYYKFHFKAYTTQRPYTVGLVSFFVIFNPFLPGSPVYMANAAEREEYVLKDKAINFQGDLGEKYVHDGANYLGVIYDKNTPVGYVKVFEQFQVIEEVMALMEETRLGKETLRKGRAMNDHVAVSRALSRLLPYDKNLEKIGYGENGVLMGNWGKCDPSKLPIHHKCPWQWTSAVQIFKQWNRNGRKAVRYGQCFVFGTLLVSALRSIGIPAKTITNFGSLHEKTNPHTHRVDFIGNKAAKEAIWDFHVWVEAFMARRDLGKAAAEWNVLDATPQERSRAGYYELGPVAKSDVLNLNYQKDPEVAFVISEVNGRECAVKNRICTHTDPQRNFNDHSVGMLTTESKLGCNTQKFYNYGVTQGYQAVECMKVVTDSYKAGVHPLVSQRFRSVDEEEEEIHNGDGNGDGRRPAMQKVATGEAKGETRDAKSNGSSLGRHFGKLWKRTRKAFDNIVSWFKETKTFLEQVFEFQNPQFVVVFDPPGAALAGETIKMTVMNLDATSTEGTITVDLELAIRNYAGIPFKKIKLIEQEKVELKALVEEHANKIKTERQKCNKQCPKKKDYEKALMENDQNGRPTKTPCDDLLKGLEPADCVAFCSRQASYTHTAVAGKNNMILKCADYQTKSVEDHLVVLEKMITPEMYQDMLAEGGQTIGAWLTVSGRDVVKEDKMADPESGLISHRQFITSIQLPPVDLEVVELGTAVHKASEADQSNEEEAIQFLELESGTDDVIDSQFQELSRMLCSMGNCDTHASQYQTFTNKHFHKAILEQKFPELRFREDGNPVLDHTHTLTLKASFVNTLTIPLTNCHMTVTSPAKEGGSVTKSVALSGPVPSSHPVHQKVKVSLSDLGGLQMVDIRFVCKEMSGFGQNMVFDVDPKPAGPHVHEALVSLTEDTEEAEQGEMRQPQKPRASEKVEADTVQR